MTRFSVGEHNARPPGSMRACPTAFGTSMEEC